MASDTTLACTITPICESEGLTMPMPSNRREAENSRDESLCMIMFISRRLIKAHLMCLPAPNSYRKIFFDEVHRIIEGVSK